MKEKSKIQVGVRRSRCKKREKDQDDVKITSLPSKKGRNANETKI